MDLIRKIFKKARDYVRAYRESKRTGKKVKDAVKLYKSHRRVKENT